MDGESLLLPSQVSSAEPPLVKLYQTSLRPERNRAF
jgi:hypothetical protein